MTKRISTLSIVLCFVLFLSAAISGTVPAKPNLKITEFKAERLQTLAVPLRVDIMIHIQNSGSGTGAANFVTRLYYRMKSSDPWQQLFDWTSGAMASGGGAVYSRTFDFEEGGTYYFKAMVDADNTVDESAEGNNTKTLTKTFQAGTPDLTVQNLTASTVNTTASGAMSVKVVWDIENIGDGKAAGSFVTVLSVSKNGGSYSEVQRYTSSNLEKNASKHFTKTASYTNFNSLRFKVVTDGTQTIHEKLEGNNTAYSETLSR